MLGNCWVRSIRNSRLPLLLQSSFCTNIKNIDPETARIGWVGTGIMGRSMVQNLIQKGGFRNVSVYNRTAVKAKRLVAAIKEEDSQVNVTVLNSPKEVAKNSDIVFSIVGLPSDVESIVFDQEKGMISELKDGKILVDCTTSKPSLAKKIATELENQNSFALDAPVSGGDIGAKNGTLSFMVGGQEQVFESLLPCFKAMGSKYELMGDAGLGQHTKMVNQIFIAAGMMGLVEGLLYAQKTNLDQTKLINLLSTGAAGSWSLSNYGPRIVKRDFEPGFCIEHFVKDLQIALEEAKEMKLNLPSLELAIGLYDALQNEGYGKYGTQALQLLVEQMVDENE